jgi:5-methylcytosine-specific restriction endonuclease McrA
MGRILILDQQGNPRAWASREIAITYHAKDLVAWQLGLDEVEVTYRGGNNRITGMQSKISTAPIIAIKGETSKRSTRAVLTNRALFRRDNFTCAYCGKMFGEFHLSRDHIVPTSRGGMDNWENVITSCHTHNRIKDDRLLEECGMKLLFQPYVPNKAEALVFEQGRMLNCQVDYLVNFLPKHSRILSKLKKGVLA